MLISLKKSKSLEAITWRCPVKELFLKISQSSQENSVPESKAYNFIKK